MKCHISFILILCVQTAIANDIDAVNFVAVNRINKTPEAETNLNITYLSESMSGKAYLQAGFVANHELVLPVEKFGGEVNKKGGRCGSFPEIITTIKTEPGNAQFLSDWAFHVAVNRREDFTVPEKLSVGQLPFIPADLNINDIDKDFRLFLFTAYNTKSVDQPNMIHIQDGINFDISNIQATDLNIAEYGVRSTIVELERYKMDHEEFLLFKLYYEDEQRDQIIQIANFLFMKSPEGSITLLEKSTDFLNWFWVREKTSKAGKYDAFPWFQGVIKHNGDFYVLTQNYGYESISVSLQKVKNNRLIDVKTYADGC